MHENGSEPEEIEGIGGVRGFLSLVAALYTVGGLRLLMATPIRYMWTTLKGWFGKG